VLWWMFHNQDQAPGPCCTNRNCDDEAGGCDACMGVSDVVNAVEPGDVSGAET
jgi:hypothetical protein